MAEEKTQALISQLHDLYADERTSPQQQQLLADLERHLHPADSADEPDPVPLETLEGFIEEMAVDHPNTALVMRQLIETLKNMGI